MGWQPLFSEVSEQVVLGRRLAMLGQGGQPVGHLRLYTKRALLEFLESCGFGHTEIRGAAFHDSSLLMRVEQALGSISGLALILVAVSQRDA
jgi:hypothetical protein